MSGPAGVATDAGAAGNATRPGLEPIAFTYAPHDASADQLEHDGLAPVLEQLRRRRANGKMRTTFLSYISDMAGDLAGAKNGMPIRPRCRAGSLMELVRAPESEDVRVFEEFDERVLRAAFTMREGAPPPPMPAWLEEEQPLDAEDKKRKGKDRERRKKKKKRRSSKRRRDGEEGEDGGEEEDDEKRSKKKRKKKKEASSSQ